MAHWSLLDDDERARLEQRALVLVATKRWEAAVGFELTDDIEVTIAAQAALIALELPDDCYSGVQSIIVHPTTMVLRGEHRVVPGLATDAPMPIAGQATQHGPVVIMWDATLDGARHPERGMNVVYHEFAHKLDMAEGSMDGTPVLGDAEELQRWVAVCTDAFERVAVGQAGPALRSYAGVNPSEFFAVATEAFFDVPGALESQEPDLYDVLRAFYRQDPARRARRPAAARPTTH